MKANIKSFFTLLILGLSTISLGSCGNNSNSGKTYIDYGTIRSKPLETLKEQPELTYEGLQSKISHKESFLLAVYNAGCGCWNDFAPVLTEFINDTGCNVSYMDVDKFFNKEETYGLYLVRSDLPCFAIFERGKLKTQSVYLKTDDRLMFKNYENHFKKFIDANVVLPKMFYIEKEDLDSYIASNKEFTLYIGRNECPDCAALETDVLHPWSDRVEKVDEKLYIFDIQKYYASAYAGSTEEEIKQYQEIKDLYGLSEKNNPILGYSTGMVPTLQRRKGNQVIDMMVALNDSLDKENKCVSSYFTTTRTANMPFLKNSALDYNLHGKSLTDEQISDWRSYKSTYYEKYHYPLANLFINSYVK